MVLFLNGNAVVVESVDTGDLKSPGGDTVRVRVPSTAPRKKRDLFGLSFFLYVGGGTRMIKYNMPVACCSQPVQKLVGHNNVTSPVNGTGENLQFRYDNAVPNPL